MTVSRQKADVNKTEKTSEEKNMETLRVLKRPADEIDMHKLTHTPFRSWCAECVKGNAKAGAHSRKKG